MSNNDLSNKVSVVTGGADGIGEGIVRTLWGCGAQVVIADIQEEKGAGLATELGGNVSFVLLDATDPDSWNSLVTELNDNPGRLDILVNNAGGGGFGNDTLKGGSGADLFLLTPGLDRILDFNPQQGDRIRSKHLLDLRITQHHNHLLLSDPKLNIHTSLLNSTLEQLLNAPKAAQAVPASPA